MSDDFLQDRAALYVSGAMTQPERENFELILAFHAELRAGVAALQEAMTYVALVHATPLAPPPGLKQRLLAAVATLPPNPAPEALVVTDAAGLVQWVNGAFTVLCGYTLEELKGRKPGHLLQGPATDGAAVARLREALRIPRACRESLVNYHKNGTPYRVDIRVTPILDDQDQPRWLVAQVRELPEAAAVTAS